MAKSPLAPAPDETPSLVKKIMRERQIAEESEAFSGPGSLIEFVKAAWPQIKKEEPYRHNWHIEAICEHLEAVTAGDIRRLQVWIPRRSMKSMNVSRSSGLPGSGREALASLLGRRRTSPPGRTPRRA